MFIHFQLDFDDILALQKNVITYSSTHKIKRSYLKWISAAIIFLVLLFSIGLSLVSVAVSAVITFVYLFVFPPLYESIAIARAKYKMQNQDYTHILAPCDLTLTNEGITRNINGETAHFSWDTFTRIGEDVYRYFLYQTELQGLILPKRPKDLSAEETKDYQTLIDTQTSQI